jgi:hypothetical protein
MLPASDQSKTQRKQKLNQDSGGPPPARDEEQVWIFYLYIFCSEEVLNIMRSFKYNEFFSSCLLLIGT